MIDLIKQDDGTFIIRVKTETEEGGSRTEESKPLSADEAKSQLYVIGKKNNREIQRIQKQYRDIRKALMEDFSQVEEQLKKIDGTTYLSIEAEKINKFLYGNWFLFRGKNAVEITIKDGKIKDEEGQEGTLKVTADGEFEINGYWKEKATLEVNAETGEVKGKAGKDRLRMKRA